MTDDGQLLTRSQAADLLGVSRVTLREWERRGFGPQPLYSPGHKPFYSRNQIDAWLGNFPTTANAT